MRKSKKRLGEMLLDEGLINDFQLAIALGEQRQYGGKVGTALVKKGFLKEADLAYTLEGQLGVKWISLKGHEASPEAMGVLQADVAKKYNVFPVALDGNTLTVAISDPTDIAVIDTLRFMTGKNVRVVLALNSEILLSIARHYENDYVADKAFTEAAETSKVVPPNAGAVHPHHAGHSRSGSEELRHLVHSLIHLLQEKDVISRKELLAVLRRENGPLHEEGS